MWCTRHFVYIICLVLGRFLGRKQKLCKVNLPKVTKLRGTSQNSNQNSSLIQGLSYLFLDHTAAMLGQANITNHGKVASYWKSPHVPITLAQVFNETQGQPCYNLFPGVPGFSNVPMWEMVDLEFLFLFLQSGLASWLGDFHAIWYTIQREDLVSLWDTGSPWLSPGSDSASFLYSEQVGLCISQLAPHSLAGSSTPWNKYTGLVPTSISFWQAP